MAHMGVVFLGVVDMVIKTREEWFGLFCNSLQVKTTLHR